MKKNTEKDQLIQNSFDNLETEKPSRSVTEKAKNYAEQHPKRLNGRGISLALRYGVAFLLVAIIIPAVSSLNNLGLFTSKSNATLESRQADMMNYVPATGNNSCYPISTKTTDISLNGDSLEGLDVLQIVFNDVVSADDNTISEDADTYSAAVTTDTMSLTEWYYQTDIINLRTLITDLAKTAYYDLKDFSFVINGKRIVATLMTDKNKEFKIIAILDNVLSDTLYAEVAAEDQTEYELDVTVNERDINAKYYFSSIKQATNKWLNKLFLKTGNEDVYIEVETDGEVMPEAFFDAETFTDEVA